VAEVEDQPSTEPAPVADTTTPHAETRRPTWRPAYPGERPPQELVDAVLAQDKQQLQQIHDPNLQLLMFKLAEAARQSDDQAITPLDCFLVQADALMNFANSLPLARSLDLLKLFRAGLIALQDYNAGSEAKLRPMRGKPPNRTKPRRPSEARERALIRLFVQVLMTGGIEEVEAERLVAKYASANGLKRTQLGVHGVCVEIDAGEDKTGADQFKLLKARLPADVHRWNQKQGLAWVERRAAIFRKLKI
jgi:hypothetical protein